MKWIVLGIIGYCYLIPQSVLAAAVDLKGLITYGIENSPSFKNSKNSLKISSLKLDNSFAKFFPSLDGSVTRGYQDTVPSSEDDQRTGKLTLSLSETLYDNGRNYTGYSIAKLAEQKARMQFSRDRDNFCLNIIKEYNAYSQSMELLKVQKFQFDLLRQQFNSIERRYKRGEKSRTDYLRFKARLQRSKLSLQQADNVAKKSLETLKAIIGWTEAHLEIEPAKIVKLNIKSDQIAQPRLEKHYDFKIATQDKDIHQQQVDLSKRKYWPQLGLNAGVTYTNDNYLGSNTTVSDEEQTSWSVLLTLKYNFWDWGIQRRNYSIAKTERNSKNAKIDQSLLDLSADLTRLTLDLQLQIENYRLNKELVELENTNYQSLQKDYRMGKSTFLDLIKAVDDLTSAKSQFFRNHFSLNTSLAEHKFHQGVLYDSIFKN